MSEVIGFVLIFALVISSIGVVYTLGFTGLQDARDAERLENAERAMDVLADNIEDLRSDDAPNRATELKLYDAGLSLGDRTSFTVRVTSFSPTKVYSVDAEPIIYTPTEGGTTLRYVNGAVIRTDRGGAVFLQEPRFLFRDTGTTMSAVFPLIQTRAIDNSAAGGTTTVLVRTELANAELLASHLSAAGPHDVEFEVTTTTERAPVWQSFLESELDDAYGDASYCSASGGTVTCSFTVDRLYVSATRVDVTIES
ncbi:hypothetical protein [Halosegnis sp.]|uniref:DUF7289 family protein n=1 Tax=Halosegnis sp. TaxID=2864959 RepID=UPI0035D40219